jgi:hypothetical protein
MISIMSEQELQAEWDSLITMEEKGYPITDAMFYVKYIDGKPIGHICFKDMGKWYFIGNSYIKRRYRGMGYYDELMTKRNEDLEDKPKIAVVIPIEDSDINRLEDRISIRGYEKIDSFWDIYGIVSVRDYIKIRDFTLWKLGKKQRLRDRIKQRILA